MPEHNWPLATPLPSEVAAMFAHHDELQADLRTRVANVHAAVSAQRDLAGPRAAAVEYMRHEIIPHALAEEDAIYKAGAEVDKLKALVDGMVMEHHALVALVDVIETATDPIALASDAKAFQVLFEAHVAKENDLLLPALVAGGTDPAKLLHDMHGAFTTRKAEAGAA